MQNNERKGSLADTFRDFGAHPSEELWQAISDELDERKKRRPGMWWWISGLGAASAVTLLLLFSGMKEERPLTALSKAKTSSEKPRLPEQPHQQTVPEQHPGSSFATANSLEKKSLTPSCPTDPKPTYPITPFTALPETNQPFIPEHTISADSAVLQKDPKAPQTASVDPLPARELTMLLRDAQHDTACSVMPGIPGKNSYSQPLVASFPKWKIGADFGFSNGQGFWGDSKTDQTAMANYGYNPFYWMPPDRYRFFEVTVNRRIHNRWWLGSGIQAGEFRSIRILDPTIDIFSPDFQLVSAHTWTFGLPLSARYDVFVLPWTHTQLYIRLGMVHTFPFRRTETYIPGENSTLASFRTEQKCFSYVGSVNATAGIEQPIWKGLSAEIRPEFNFYYKPPVNSITMAPIIKVPWWIGWNFSLNWTF